jgi:anti-sigma B factor antagonist
MKRILLERIHKNRLVAFDLSNIRYLNSTGLGLLLTALRAIHGEGDLRLFGVQPTVLEFLRLTRMDRVLAVDPDEKTAIANLRDSQGMDQAA